MFAFKSFLSLVSCPITVDFSLHSVEPTWKIFPFWLPNHSRTQVVTWLRARWKTQMELRELQRPLITPGGLNN